MRLSVLSLAVSLAAADDLSTYSWYTDVPASYRCLLSAMPDFDQAELIASPSYFISVLEERPATYYAGLVGMTTGCAFETGAAARRNVPVETAAPQAN